MSRILDAGVVALCLAAAVSPAAARQAAAADDGLAIVPHFGFAIGAGSIPRAFEPNCIDGWEGSTASVAVEVRAGLNLGRFGLEARTAPHTEAGLGGAAGCLAPDPIRADGVHTVRSSPIDRGPFIQSDLRLTYSIRYQPVEWLISSGAGIVWGRDVPALVFGTGIRFGSDLRGVLDAEFNMYRVPWEETTETWFAEEIVDSFDTGSERLWQKGFAIRLGLEVVLGR